MSSCLCKWAEGAGFPFQVEALEDGVNDAIHTLHVDKANHVPSAAAYFDEAAFDDIGGPLRKQNEHLKNADAGANESE
jgi:hypothetical protein